MGCPLGKMKKNQNISESSLSCKFNLKLKLSSPERQLMKYMVSIDIYEVFKLQIPRTMIRQCQ